MSSYKDSQGRAMTAWYSVTVREMDDGTADLAYHRMDMATHKLVQESLSQVEQPARQPFMAHELLTMAAMEVFARAVGEQMPLPW